MVERIRRGAHLQEYRVQPHRGDIVQNGIGFAFERVSRQTLRGGIVNIVYGGDPHAAHAVLRGLCRVGDRKQHREHQNDGKNASFQHGDTPLKIICYVIPILPLCPEESKDD